MNSATESPVSGTSERQETAHATSRRDASPPEQGRQPQVEHVEVAAPNARASVTETIKTAAQSAPRTAGVDEAPAGPSWAAFGGRHFPCPRRHHLDALGA